MLTYWVTERKDSGLMHNIFCYLMSVVRKWVVLLVGSSKIVYGKWQWQTWPIFVYFLTSNMFLLLLKWNSQGTERSKWRLKMRQEHGTKMCQCWQWRRLLSKWNFTGEQNCLKSALLLLGSTTLSHWRPGS